MVEMPLAKRVHALVVAGVPLEGDLDLHGRPRYCLK